jgi:hypothetical protein
LFSRSASNSARSCPSTPGAPLLALTCRHASHTIRLGIANDLSLGFGLLIFVSSQDHRPQLNDMHIPGEPAPSLHPHPSEQKLHRYYEPVRRQAPHRYSLPPVSAVGRLPLTTLEAYDPGRRIDARLLTFRARAADQAHAASTPDTTWPIHGHPPDSSRESKIPLGFDAISSFRRLNDDTRTKPTTRPSALERLPDPHLTRSSRAFPLVAHHDGLQPTQHQGGLAPTPVGRRWRASKPPSLAQHHLCKGSSTRPLLQCS